MEKETLVRFIATVMEDSGFIVKKNYHVSNQVIDIYAILNTSVGEVSAVVACKNYEEPWKIGIDIIKDMEIAAKTVNASKIIIITTSSFSHGATVYAKKRNIKLVDRKELKRIAKTYKENHDILTEDEEEYEEEYDGYTEYYEPVNGKPGTLYRSTDNDNHHAIFSGFRRRQANSTSEYYRNSLDDYPHYSLSYRTPKKRFNPLANIDVESSLEFFKKHEIVYFILLILIASVIAFCLSKITNGPYTGMGRILLGAIICYGGVLLINRNTSDILFKGSVMFFITMLISVFTLNM
ncbi:MAG: hypothetical protein BZ136_04440 [Methanosphaera sp. rholeuAM74]|nr:MAG: hypothetical protein BZ136_04440 [Methanosphaera sp. rholeuAM74]